MLLENKEKANHEMGRKMNDIIFLLQLYTGV